MDSDLIIVTNNKSEYIHLLTLVKFLVESKNMLYDVAREQVDQGRYFGNKYPDLIG